LLSTSPLQLLHQEYSNTSSSTPYSIMHLQLPPDASDILEKGNQYALEMGEVLVYGLNDTTSDAVQQICDKATETFAKEVLNWPNGRLAKPDIFKGVTSDSQFKDLGDCLEAFLTQLRNLFQSSPPKALPIFPHAFIVVETKDPKTTDIATVVLAYKSRGNWRLEHCSIPIHVELGQQIDSLRMGDESAERILDMFSDQRADATQNPSPDTNGWAFALFSTGLKGALPLQAMIDPATDEVDPSEATLYLVADPDNSQFLMSKQRMIELFPVVVRDDIRRGWRTNNMRLHSKVLIYCDNDKPKDKGVIVVLAEWDGDLDRKDKELKEAFGNANFQEHRVSVDKALEKACELAEK
jgi:hypothetical protein